ncbi:hypothetical protein V2J09_011465 [Rumex salicifolius]
MSEVDVKAPMECDSNLKDTELRLGLPGSQAKPETLTSTTGSRGSKRASPDTNDNVMPCDSHSTAASANKAQVVGWPPVRSYRRNNSFQMYVKVSMDGAPFLRKIDIKGYEDYPNLFKALEAMFKFKFVMGELYEGEGYKESDFVPTYEDKDGDWMLVGDVPWEMFVSSCKKLRVVKRSEAKGLVCGI